MLRKLLSRVRGAFRRSRLDEELDDEIRGHLTMLQERFVRRGMDPAEAFQAARRQFGGATQLKEELMERRSLPRIDALAQDVRHAFRRLRRSKRFTASAALTLALGIGATTTIFSIVNTILLRPLPFEEPDRLMRIFVRPGPGGGRLELAPGKFYDWQREAQSFERMAMYRVRDVALTGIGAARTVRSTAVGAGFFEIVRARPAFGRVFRPDEDEPGRKYVVILSDRFWRTEFGGSPDAIGRTVKLNDEAYAIVGVMPATASVAS